MLSRILSGAILGVDAYIVRVEADVAPGLPSFATVGLPQGAVREGKERVLAAIKNSGFEVPPRRITINLAPADIRKGGSGFDLPIALGILEASGQIEAAGLEGMVALGELGLDGRLRPVRGSLSIASEVRTRRLGGLIVPLSNLAEASMIPGIRVLGARQLREVVDFLAGKRDLTSTPVDGGGSAVDDRPTTLDLVDVRGLQHVRRAIEVAAAGAHNAILIGPPGSGKTMIAKRLPGILPSLTSAETVECTKIHSVAGLLDPALPMVRSRPFRSPHHSTSDAGLVGGGPGPLPGEVSLAHNGVLFLDELPEFRRNALEALRQPMEDGEVSISRAGRRLSFPSRFMLVAAMNPCPCGYLGDIARPCRCPPALVQKYRARISGPLFDRIDVQIPVNSAGDGSLSADGGGETSERVRERIVAARQVQHDRFGRRDGVYANAHMSPADIRQHCRLGASEHALLQHAVRRLGLSARAYHRILRVARTIADLDGSTEIVAPHLAEAIQYRSMDREPIL